MLTHVRTLGWLHIALGALGLFGAMVVWLIGGSIAGILHMLEVDVEVPSVLIAMIMTAIGLFIAAISVPAVIAGWGLINLRRWARVLTLVLSAFNLFHIPFGTALAIYGFWVLLKPETEVLFREPPYPAPVHP